MRDSFLTGKILFFLILAVIHMGCLEQGLSFNTKNSVLENVPKFSATVEDVSVSLKPRQNISDSTLKPSLICCKYIL